MWCQNSLNHQMEHNHNTKWKHILHYWPFVQGIHQWIPLTKASDMDLSCFFYLHLNKQLSKQKRCRWLEMPSRPLRCHHNVKLSMLLMPSSDHWCQNKISSLHIASDLSHNFLQLVLPLVVAIYYWSCDKLLQDSTTNQKINCGSPWQVAWLSMSSHAICLLSTRLPISFTVTLSQTTWQVISLIHKPKWLAHFLSVIS